MRPVLAMLLTERSSIKFSQIGLRESLQLLDWRRRVSCDWILYDGRIKCLHLELAG